jgi:hypothetical protein
LAFDFIDELFKRGFEAALQECNLIAANEAVASLSISFSCLEMDLAFPIVNICNLGSCIMLDVASQNDASSDETYEVSR